MTKVWAQGFGDMDPLDTICGTTDDRALSTDSRIARIHPRSCTAFLIDRDGCSNRFLTAGHCIDPGEPDLLVHFNVPLALPSGAVAVPPPEDQFPILSASIQSTGNAGEGVDAAQFFTGANSNTGLHARVHIGGSAFTLASAAPAASGQTVRVTGHGIVVAPVSMTWNRAQKTHTGSYTELTGSEIRHQVDTTAANSGSPIILETSGQVIGVHTHGGCDEPPPDDTNAGTAVEFATLQSYLSSPLGPCAGPCIGDGEWLALGPNYGMNHAVNALAVYNGEVIAAGSFSSAGGFSVNRIARWNSTAWNSLGDGIGSTYAVVSALTVHDGKLIAGGWFTIAGGASADNVAIWDGTSWAPIGSGTNERVLSLVVHNDNLIAGGYFTTAGGVAAKGVARWDGAAWSAVGNISSHTNPHVYALVVYNGDIVAGGYFGNPLNPDPQKIARWDGSSWQALDSGMNGNVWSLAVYNGDLIAGGDFTQAGGVSASRIARWDGSSWHALGSGVYGLVHVLSPYKGDLIVGGGFFTPGGGSAEKLARWDGSLWYSMNSGITGIAAVYALTAYKSELIVGGGFTTGSNPTLYSIARLGCLPCYADCNSDAALSSADFGCFQTRYAMSDPYADCNDDGSINLADFSCFQMKYAEGCY